MTAYDLEELIMMAMLSGQYISCTDVYDTSLVYFLDFSNREVLMICTAAADFSTYTFLKKDDNNLSMSFLLKNYFDFQLADHW